MAALIYVLKNKINGKIYVGLTRDWKQRLYYHLRQKKSAIGHAISKYGIEQFDIFLFPVSNISLISELEQRFIRRYKSLAPNGYNLTTGGKKYWNISETTREKLVFNSTGERNPHFGKPMPKQHRRHISEAKMGVPLSKEHRAKMKGI